MTKLPVAKFLIPYWEICSRLWHRAAVPARQTMYPGGPVYDNPMTKSAIFPQSWTNNLANETNVNSKILTSEGTEHGSNSTFRIYPRPK